MVTFNLMKINFLWYSVDPGALQSEKLREQQLHESTMNAPGNQQFLISLHVTS
jgi:hypothetical protein